MDLLADFKGGRCYKFENPKKGSISSTNPGSLTSVSILNNSNISYRDASGKDSNNNLNKDKSAKEKEKEREKERSELIDLIGSSKSAFIVSLSL